MALNRGRKLARMLHYFPLYFVDIWLAFLYGLVTEFLVSLILAWVLPSKCVVIVSKKARKIKITII